jgi:hypothetical protein
VLIGGCLPGQAVYGNQQTFSRCMGQPASCYFSHVSVTSVQLSPRSLYFPGTIHMYSFVHTGGRWSFRSLQAFGIETFYYSLALVVIIFTYIWNSKYSERKQAVCKLAVCCAACLQIGNDLEMEYF